MPDASRCRPFHGGSEEALALVKALGVDVEGLGVYGVDVSIRVGEVVSLTVYRYANEGVARDVQVVADKYRLRAVKDPDQ